MRFCRKHRWIKLLSWGTSIALFWATATVADAPKLLQIPEKNRIVVNKETHLIVVLDLKPSSEELKSAGTDADGLVLATAKHYAREYLSKTDFIAVPKAVVYLIAVDSMDEYNRANFAGMKRYGTLTFSRKGADIILEENKMTLKDAR